MRWLIVFLLACLLVNGMKGWLQRIGLGQVVLFEADASNGAFGKQTFSVTDFIGEESQGTWRLLVSDVAPGDTGTLNGWSLEIKR